MSLGGLEEGKEKLTGNTDAAGERRRETAPFSIPVVPHALITLKVLFKIL